MHVRLFATSALAFGLVCAQGNARAADRGPSTPEERKQALQYIQDFQTDPLASRSNDEQAWVMKWLIQVPDITVHMCSVLDKLPKGEKKHSGILIEAIALSQLAFVLQNPEKTDDLQAESLAGVEGVLKVYEALIKSNPKDRQPYLDELLQRKEAGTLASFVQDRVASGACKR